MTLVRIYGASDDLVEIDGDHPIAEEYGPGEGDIFQAELIGSGTEGAILTVAYDFGGQGTWMIGLTPYEEGYVIPERWGAKFVQPKDREPNYSAILELDLADTDTLTVTKGTDHR